MCINIPNESTKGQAKLGSMEKTEGKVCDLVSTQQAIHNQPICKVTII